MLTTPSPFTVTHSTAFPILLQDICVLTSTDLHIPLLETVVPRAGVQLVALLPTYLQPTHGLRVSSKREGGLHLSEIQGGK